MDFDPRLNKFQLGGFDLSLEHFAAGNSKHRFVLRILYVDMWQVVLLVIEEVHQDDNAVKHGYDGHGIVSVFNGSIRPTPSAAPSPSTTASSCATAVPSLPP